MKIIDKLTNLMKEALFVDKVLFPSRFGRNILYMLVINGFLIAVASLLCSEAVPALFLVLFGVYLILVSSLLWIAKATRYIRNNERMKEG